MRSLYISLAALCLVGCAEDLQINVDEISPGMEIEEDINLNKYEVYVDALIDSHERGVLNEFILRPDPWGRSLVVIHSDTCAVVKSSGVSIDSEKDDIVITLRNGFYVTYRYNGANFAYSEEY